MITLDQIAELKARPKDWRAYESWLNKLLQAREDLLTLAERQLRQDANTEDVPEWCRAAAGQYFAATKDQIIKMFVDFGMAAAAKDDEAGDKVLDVLVDWCALAIFRYAATVARHAKEATR